LNSRIGGFLGITTFFGLSNRDSQAEFDAFDADYDVAHGAS